MNAIFELLFKYRPPLFEKGALALRAPWPGYVTWLLAGAAVALAFLLYRRVSGSLSAGWWFGLSGLRALSLLVVLAMFLQPVLVLHSVIPQKSFVAVAYDVSKSMEIHDGAEGQSRLEIQQHLLRPAGNRLVEELAAKFKLRYFRFSSSAERAGGVEYPPRHGNMTDLDRSLNQVVAELGSAPVSGVVLITDGADNRSRNLAVTAAQLKARRIPVFPIGIGADGFSRDTEVVRVSAPRKVLKDTMIEADVAVRATGYPGRRARLQVKERDRVVQSQEITLGSDGEVKTYKVNFTPEAAGSKVFTFRVEPFQDELISENNDRSVLVRVEDERPGILYVEGEPRWIYGFLRRASLEDKNLHLVTLLRQADGKFLRQGVESGTVLEKGFPVDRAELFQYRAIILGSVEASFFTFDQLRLISDFVGQRGGGFLMLGGKNSFAQGGYVNTPLEDVLPVNLRSGAGKGAAPPFSDVEFKARLTAYGLEHPVTRMSLLEPDNRKRWESAPTLVGMNPTSGAKPGATVLLQGAGDRAESAVLLAFQRFGRGKSMALATGSTWRWRMEQDHRDNFHELFWKQMLRWLVSDVPDAVKIETEKHSYSLDEPVVLRAEVNDPGFMHLNNARISVQVKAPSGQLATVPLTWEPDQEGVYSATYKAQEDGIYEISTEAFQGEKSLGSAKASFRVADSSDEYHDAALNSSLLRQLAANTGGRYYTPGDAQHLAEDISYVDNGASRIEEKELWDMPVLFLLLVGAVSSEWILRKRKGLA